MPYTTPGDVTTGTTITSAWGNLVGNATDFLANPPACRVYNNAGLTHTSNNNWQALSGFNSEHFDTDSMHSTSVNTGRITINTAGLYVVGGSFEFAANATGARGIGLYLNGNTDVCAPILLHTVTGTFGAPLCISAVYKFAVGNYVELRGFQNSGGNLNISRYANGSPEFWACWIGLG